MSDQQDAAGSLADVLAELQRITKQLVQMQQNMRLDGNALSVSRILDRVQAPEPEGVGHAAAAAPDPVALNNARHLLCVARCGLEDLVDARTRFEEGSEARRWHEARVGSWMNGSWERVLVAALPALEARVTELRGRGVSGPSTQTG